MRKFLFLVTILATSYFPAFTQTSSQTKTATLFNNLNESYLNLWSQAGPQYFSTDDDSYAYSKRLGGKRSTLLLVLRGFEFSIPTGATIENISVTVRRFKKGKGSVKDYFATLLRTLPLDNLNQYGVRWTNQADYPATESEVTYTQNGSGSDGGLNNNQFYQWTPELINDPGFGIRIDNLQPVGGSVVIYYDLAQITVQYSLPVPKAITFAQVSEAKPLKEPVVYPNPFTDKANIQFRAAENGKATVQLYDITGAKVRTLFSGDVVKEQVYNISIGDSQLPNGVFIYIITNAKRKQTGKIIKLK